MYGPGKASPRRAPSSKHLEVVRERAVEVAAGGRAFQAEATASAQVRAAAGWSLQRVG